MAYRFQKNGTELTVWVEGEINSVTAFELDALLTAELPGVKLLALDLTDCSYVTSAGIRVMLAAHKRMRKENGSMRLSHVGAFFLELLQNLGLDTVFDIQQQ